MENYLRDLAGHLRRISRASLDMGTGKKLREIAQEVSEKADEFEQSPPAKWEGSRVRRDH
jgi:hypothetical protein